MNKALHTTREKGLLHQMIKVCRTLCRRGIIKLNIVWVPLAIYVIKKRKLTGLNEILDFVYTFRILGLSIRPVQIREEIEMLLKILHLSRPRRILEIGTANGGTLFLFCRVASDDATIISIDLPGGPFGGGYPKWKIPLYRSFAKRGQKLYLIRADFHDPRTLEEVKRILGDEKLDFLFIDGDHTYEGVKKDFEMYFPLVKRGGIIAFHDICPGPKENVGGVPDFWSEIKHYFTRRELVKDWKQGGYGIGILHI